MMPDSNRLLLLLLCAGLAQSAAARIGLYVACITPPLSVGARRGIVTMMTEYEVVSKGSLNGKLYTNTRDKHRL